VDRGYEPAQSRIDLLMEYQLMAPNIFTNPPFKLFKQMAAHALSLGPRKMIFLGKLSALSRMECAELWDDPRFARYYVFRYGTRPSLLKDGDEAWLGSGGMLDLCWFVWEAGADTHGELRRIGKD